MKSLLFYLCFLSLVLGACNTNPCEDLLCGNGTCDNGKCDCFTGYESAEGGNCNQEIRQKFLGGWIVNERDNLGNNYSSQILVDPSPDINQFYIINLVSGTLVANMISPTSFEVKDQFPVGSNSFVRSTGSGTISGNTVSYTYSYRGYTYSSQWRK